MNIKNYVFLLLALLFVTDASAQYDPWWQWAKADTINTSPVATSGSILAVKFGKALWGHMTAVKHFTPDGIPEGNYNVTEYDSTGRQLNVTLMQGKVQLLDAQADNFGNWYVLGSFYDTLLFSGGLRFVRNNPASNVDADHFMVRFNAGSMAISWCKPVGPFTTVSARAFTIDNANNRIIIPADSLNYTVIRSMDISSGDAKTLFTQSGQSTTTSIAQDARGDFYLTGTCSTLGMDFNGATESANTIASSYIVKYRANGTHAWHLWMRDPTCNRGKATLFMNRFLYYTNSLSDSMTIGGVHLGLPNGPDFVAARLDTAGNVIWARQKDLRGGGNASLGDPYHAVITPDTALVMFTQANGYMYWRDSVETNLQGVNDGCLVSIGSDNHTRWARPIYTQYTTNQRVVSEGTAIWVTGNIYSPEGAAMFDTLKLRVAAYKYNAYLARTKMIRPPYVPPSSVAGVSEDNLRLYPIPVHTTLQIDGLEGNCRIRLFDMTGRMVQSIESTTGTRQTTMDVANLSRGTYVLELSNDRGLRMTRKVILQ
jgi:hypothetical protein